VLLEAGAEVDHADDDGDTPLFEAAVSALPTRKAARSTATLHRKRCPLPPQRAEARTTCVLRVNVTPTPSFSGSQHVVQVAESVERDR
jgi:hypothetical protein